ncbi:MAG: hypothetical protein PHQ43_04280 [Dehalococcoidales bacterium]|nr:hypothetical protein [Dehalococcoidales bacterium]
MSENKDARLLKWQRLSRCRKQRSSHYETIIETNLPMRWYWTEAGFDGIEFGPLPQLSNHQMRQLDAILDNIGALIECSHALMEILAALGLETEAAFPDDANPDVRQERIRAAFKKVLSEKPSEVPDAFKKAFGEKPPS